MSSSAARLLVWLLLAPVSLPAADLPGREWFNRRFQFHPQITEEREVQGLQERIAGGKLHLTIKDYLELVLRNSTEVNLVRLDVFTAAEQITAAKAPCDPLLTLGYNILHSVFPESSQIGGASTLSSLTQNSFVNFQDFLSAGQTVSVGYSASRSSTNSAFNLFNPYLTGLLSFQVTQPLLQGRTGIQARGPLEIARTQLIVTSRLSEARISGLVATAGGQYWDAIRARDNIKVLQATFDLAQKSYEHDKLALDLGALASLDIYQSETQLAERKRDLVQAQHAYQSSLDGLRRAVGADLTAELRGTELVLEDEPSALPPKASILPFEEALSKALHARPEVDAAQRQLSIDDLNARVARNLMLPRLDLTAQGQAAGLSGNQVPFIGPLGISTPAVSGGFADSLGQVFGFAYPAYGAGLQLTFPLRSSAAQAQLSDALINKVRDRYNERQIEQQITQDVRLALNAIDLANATIDAAVRARDLAGKNVEAEQQKYELGTITAFEVLDSQTRLASAESALLNAYVAYQQAFLSYQQATWTLLDNLGMVLENPKVK